MGCRWPARPAQAEAADICRWFSPRYPAMFLRPCMLVIFCMSLPQLLQQPEIWRCACGIGRGTVSEAQLFLDEIAFEDVAKLQSCLALSNRSLNLFTAFSRTLSQPSRTLTQLQPTCFETLPWPTRRSCPSTFNMESLPPGVDLCTIPAGSPPDSETVPNLSNPVSLQITSAAVSIVMLALTYVFVAARAFANRSKLSWSDCVSTESSTC